MESSALGGPSLPNEGELIVVRGKAYLIGKFINQGAFGLVYECTDRWSNELVAKVLRPQGLAPGAVLDAWSREAKNLLHLRHPHITYIYDVFEHKGLYYIIVERCGGDLNSLFTLPDYAGELWLPALARDVLQAIDYIHNEGYIHKDLHPGNIFVAWSRDRMVPSKPHVVSFKVGDLGIAREESNIDIFNTLLAQWMLPPEALNPTEFGPVNRGIDTYHIGLVLLSVLLGRVPEFTRDEILEGKPREMAEQLQSPYSQAIAFALRRHAKARANIVQLWDELLKVMPPTVIPY